jgi:hypothetical protein
MRWVNGDIWIYYKLGGTIVIPTNAGWKSDSSNVMGRGLAKQASEKFKNLSLTYGQYCKSKQPHCYFENMRLILVPSKKLNEKQPWLSWQHEADQETIRNSLTWLQQNVKSFQAEKIYVPILGSGNGNMQKGLVQEMMDNILINPKFIGVDYV